MCSVAHSCECGISVSVTSVSSIRRMINQNQNTQHVYGDSFSIVHSECVQMELTKKTKNNIYKYIVFTHTYERNETNEKKEEETVCINQRLQSPMCSLEKRSLTSYTTSHVR